MLLVLNLNVLIVFQLLLWVAKSKTLMKITEDGSIEDANNIILTNKIFNRSRELKLPLKKSNRTVGSNTLKVVQVPKVYFDKATLTLEVLCNVTEGLIKVHITINKNGDYNNLVAKEKTVFQKFVKCTKTEHFERYNITLKLPRYLAYKPGYSNKYSIYIEEAILKVWLLRKSYDSYLEKTEVSNKEKNPYFSWKFKILEPFERPERPIKTCFQWPFKIIKDIRSSNYRPTCQIEKETVKAIHFPVALSGFHTGVHRTYTRFRHTTLRKKQLENIINPQFSFVMWLYVDDHCPSKLDSCSILQHITWDDNYATPQISTNQKGQVIVELVTEDGTSIMDVSEEGQCLPRSEWSRLVLACYPGQCNLTMSYGKNWEKGWNRSIKLQNASPLYFDDTVGLMVYGGSEMNPSFQGYIGQALFYRNRAVHLSQLPEIRSNDVMMRLQLTKKESRCSKYTGHLDLLIRLLKDTRNERWKKAACMADQHAFFESIQQKQEQCSAFKLQRSVHYEFVYRVIKDYSRRGWAFSKEDIADDVYEEAETVLDKKGPKKMDLVLSLLKQSSCLGNHDATYMLSVVLNYGLTVESQELLSHSYLMTGGLAGNRLCLLALANKHVYGLDGFPVDYEQAYVYLKAVADMTNRDLEDHKKNDVYTEMVRLTNHYEVDEQTEEDGDVVTYLRLQADQGDFSATQTLARMYYWGSGGLERDVARAVDYYRLAALHNEPSALYDYGIILMKGHGVEKNMSGAIEVLRKAADLGYPQALNTLGWYYMVVVNNFTEAASLFMKSHEVGNKDASYNIAHMFLNGIYPGSPVDKVKAWKFLAAGALRGQFEASIMIGMYNVRGHPKIKKDLSLAIGWTRYVAEQNPGIGRLLFKGVKAYKEPNWFSTLVFYLMAASTGVEVANFNLAYLCEEDNGGFVKLLEKECVWRHYNLSIQRSPKDVDPYAWNKMAHYYYYHGIDGRNDTQTAVELYANAAISGDPHGLYNLAMMSNEGVAINEYILNQLMVPIAIQKNHLLLSFHLLTRCQDSYSKEAYLPCTFGMYRIAFVHYCTLVNAHYKKVFSVVIVVIICILSLNVIHRRQTRPGSFYLD